MLVFYFITTAGRGREEDEVKEGRREKRKEAIKCLTIGGENDVLGAYIANQRAAQAGCMLGHPHISCGNLKGTM